MKRLLEIALIAWIGKKLWNRAHRDSEPAEDETPAKTVAKRAGAKPKIARRTAHKPRKTAAHTA
jgi:hypothetical protein